jgi:ferredoxin
MPEVTFLNDEVTVEVKPGSTVQLAAQLAGSALPFGCRAGTCGTCILRVVSGLQSLEEPGFVEADTLAEFGKDGTVCRLGCQLIVEEEPISVKY